MSEPFDQLLREKLAELEADDAEQEALKDDPVEHLRLAASRAVLASGGPLATAGPQAYNRPAPPNASDEPHKLDLIY